MRGPVFRGGTMALYAIFIGTVGLGLLALTVDVGRLYSAKARLMSATEAACSAYVRSLDTKWFMDRGKTRLSPSAAGNAYEVFVPSAPEGATLQLSSQVRDDRVVAVCTGRYETRPIIGIVPMYEIEARSAAKADFATTRNW
jgi:Flp pilus assembly protein TadG